MEFAYLDYSVTVGDTVTFKTGAEVVNLCVIQQCDLIFSNLQTPSDGLQVMMWYSWKETEQYVLVTISVVAGPIDKHQI